MAKCQCCGQVLDRSTAFVVRGEKYNKYYCNESEYESMKLNRNVMGQVLDLYKEISGSTQNYQTINKVLSPIMKQYTALLTYECMVSYKTEFSSILNKDFVSEFGQLKYFGAVLTSKIAEYKAELKKKSMEFKPQQVEEPLQTVKVHGGKKKRAAFADIEVDL